MKRGTCEAEGRVPGLGLFAQWWQGGQGGGTEELMSEAGDADRWRERERGSVSRRECHSESHRAAARRRRGDGALLGFPARALFPP